MKHMRICTYAPVSMMVQSEATYTHVLMILALQANPENIYVTELQRKLLPSHTYSHVSGGLPLDILNLTVRFLLLYTRTCIHTCTYKQTQTRIYRHTNTHTIVFHVLMPVNYICLLYCIMNFCQWEDLKQFHKKHYHPSNARYGHAYITHCIELLTIHVAQQKSLTPPQHKNRDM